MRNLSLILPFLTILPFAGTGKDYATTIQSLPPSIEFIENQGQWDDYIQFKSDLPGGEVYVENGKLIYVFYNQEDLNRIHELKHGHLDPQSKGGVIRGHRFDIHFLDANPDARFSGKDKRPNYYNFFLGNDASRWAGEVPAFFQLYAENIWEGIDYRIYSQGQDLKYDFIVRAGASTEQVKVELNYLDEIRILNGNLQLKTSVNELIDLSPVAYQFDGEGYTYVACEFSLNGNIISYTFPNGYDKSLDLVIDPKLIFSSYSGSTKDNWGTTATYDDAGNLYAAGMVFTTSSTTSYPTTTGAFQVSYAGGQIDMGISKFNATGTALIFSTYLGGSLVDVPHSLVVTKDNQLVVMGTSASTNYPTTSGAYDASFNITGSPTRSIFSNFITFNGSDVVVTKFNSAGTSLVGSTYVGGTGFDGINTNNLRYNYGDELRGEVVVDGSGNCYVATTTESTNFPVTNSSIFRGGLQDAVVFKLDSTLSNLIFSTYLGGNQNDAAYSIQVDGSGKCYVAGGTNSSTFPTTSGTIHASPLGGIDGYVTIFNSAGGTIFASTRLGTSAYDQAYFVQLDDSGFVYVTGQTEGSYSIFPSTVYKNQFSGQFIHKMSSNLTATVFSTVFGTGGTSTSIDVDISPSAFLVNQCGHIYVAGWGGPINASLGQPSNSSTTGLPITSGAHKATTDGADFYLIVLDRDADSLLYASFFGGNNSSHGEHNDGGTSRFDKKGIVYQAVCAGCGGNNNFPASPANVWSTTNGSGNCNLGVIKFDLSQIKANIGLDSVTKVCIPGVVQFQNNSDGGNRYYWDFGDGTTSTQFEPAHLYADTGTFVVMLVVEDSISCFATDTVYISVKGEAPPLATVDTIPVICPGDSILLQAHGGLKYEWFPKTHISNDTVSSPLVYPPSTTVYTVVVSDSCGSDTSNFFAYDSAIVTVTVAVDPSGVSGHDTVCAGNSIQLQASGGMAYLWSPSTYLSKNNVPNPICTPLSSINYTVRITDVFGCEWLRDIRIRVEDSANPEVGVHPDTVICLGDSIQIYAYGGSHYFWSPPGFIDDLNSEMPVVYPPVKTEYVVQISTKCFTTSDTVLIDVEDFVTTAMPDTFACEGLTIELWASPGEEFSWLPAGPLDDAGKNRPLASIDRPTTFFVTAESKYGCISHDSVHISLRDKPFVSAGTDQFIHTPFTVVSASGNGSVQWEPSDLAECPTCKETVVSVPFESLIYIVTLTDKFGCVNSDYVLISKVDDNLFVPNTFTPNSDRINEVWKPEGENIENYELLIFNRWGQLIFTTKSLENGWDGTYKGTLAENGVYVWKITYNQNGKSEEKFGTVTLLK